jgi:hypothetical protein
MPSILLAEISHGRYHFKIGLSLLALRARIYATNTSLHGELTISWLVERHARRYFGLIYFSR